MRGAYRAAILILAVCAVSSMLIAQRPNLGPIAADCNRACLEGLINQYLDAVLAHDPKRLPLSADVKYTEQEQVMSVGDGFWKSVTARGNYREQSDPPCRNDRRGCSLSLQFNLGASAEREVALNTPTSRQAG
jgi:hypothetical protein